MYKLSINDRRCKKNIPTHRSCKNYLKSVYRLYIYREICEISCKYVILRYGALVGIILTHLKGHYIDALYARQLKAKITKKAIVF